MHGWRQRRRWYSPPAPLYRNPESLTLTATAGFKRLGFVLLAALAAAAGVFMTAAYLLSADTVRQQALSEIRTVTGLDPILVNSIHRLILDAHKRFGFTAVVVSHEIPEIFDIAQTVAMLDNGIIVEHNSPAAIMASANPVIRQFITGTSNGQTGPEQANRFAV